MKIPFELIDKEVDQFLNKMMELGCVSVQILSTFDDPMEQLTFDKYYGRGNWYSRIGMAQDFLNRDRSETNSDRIASKLWNNEGDDGKEVE